MADEINPRAFRTYDPHAHDRSSAPDPHGNDPLAELARLIGQNNTLGDMAGGSRRSPEARPAAERRTEAPRTPRESYDQLDENGTGHPHDGAHFGYPDSGRAGARGSDRPLPVEEQYDRSYYERHAYEDRPFEDRPDAYQDGYNEPMYSGAPSEEMGYEADAYYDDENAGGEDDGMYDEAPRPRRRRLAKVIAVAALAVIGTGGAYSYRTIFAGGPKIPPVIKAEAGPNKVIPASQSDSQSGKLIYDRLGDSGQGEKMVSREEQPVDVASAAQPAQSGPRIVFPPLITNGQPATPPPEPVSAASPFPPQPPASKGNEPKKIRTVTIHPEGADPFARANPPPTRSASAAPVPAPAPTRSVASASAPLSIVPQNGSSNENTRAATTASLASTSAHAASTRAPAHKTAPAGSFNVQLLAQKTEEEAQASFRALQTKYPNILGGREPIFKRKDLGDKGIFYGAQVGPFASREEANQLCDNLKSQGGSCLVQRN